MRGNRLVDGCRARRGQMRPELMMLWVGRAFLAFIVLGGIYTASGWIASRGIRISEAACQPHDQGWYLASANVENRDNAYKAVSVRLQARFTPPKGERWPHPDLREQYSAVSQWTAVLLPPRGGDVASAEFRLPVPGAFDCTVQASTERQVRFREPPTAAQVAEALRGAGTVRRRALR